MEMVAPALGNNPRRLKQFLNLFRLRHYIAQRTGQLRAAEQGLGLTLPQLGKIVAVELRWPQLLDKLLRNPTEIVSLYKSDARDALSRLATIPPELITLLDYQRDEGRQDYLLNSGLLVNLPTLYGTSPEESPTSEASRVAVPTNTA